MNAFDKIKSTLRNPEFQRQVAHGAGAVAGIVASAVIATMVQRGIDAGIDAVMDKIQSQQTVSDPTVIEGVVIDA